MVSQELIVMGIGLVLFCADQISDIVILVQGDFYSIWISIPMYVFFILNILTVLTIFAAKNITYTNYFLFQLCREQQYSKRLFISDIIFEKLSFYWTFFWNAIVAIFWYIILTFIQMLILWFGFYKLHSIHKNIKKILQNFLFLSEQNEDNDFDESMKIMCFKLDFIEKIFENLPQLILQSINVWMQGGEFTKIQIISISLSILDIIYNIILAISYKFDDINKIIESIKDISKLFPYLEAIQVLQLIFYLLIAIPYQWVDYLDFQDQETHGKDVHDSIRTFIVVFPLAWLFNACIIIYRYIRNKGFKSTKKALALSVPLVIKNAVIVQVCFDLLLVKTPPFEYGQSIMNGSDNMNVFIIIISISQLADVVLFYFKYLKGQLEFKYTYGYVGHYGNSHIFFFVGYVAILAYLIIEIKMVSHWITFLQYYDNTKFEEKQLQKKKYGISCNESFESQIKGMQVVFGIFFVIKLVYTLRILKVDFTQDLMNFVMFGITLTLVIFDTCYIINRNQSQFCDNLIFVQKEENILFSIYLILCLPIMLYSLKRLKSCI